MRPHRRQEGLGRLAEPRPLLVAGVADDEQQAGGGEVGRPHGRREVAAAEHVREHEAGHERREEGEHDDHATAVGEHPRPDRRRVAVDRPQQPGRQVDHDADAAREGREHEGDADQGDVDAVAPREAAGDAGEHPVVAAAGERAPTTVPAPALVRPRRPVRPTGVRSPAGGGARAPRRVRPGRIDPRTSAVRRLALGGGGRCAARLGDGSMIAPRTGQSHPGGPRAGRRRSGSDQGHAR